MLDLIVSAKLSGIFFTGYLKTSDRTETPSPLEGEGWGEGEHAIFTPTLTLPHQGGGEMG